MYIGNYFRKHKVPVAGLQKRISFLPARGAVFLAKLFRELFLELSFLWQKFRCKIFDAGTFVEYLRAFRRSRALRGDIFMRQETFSLYANRIPFDFIVGLPRTWPHVIAFRFLKITQGRCKYLAESVEPDFFGPKDGFGGKRGSKGNWTRNVEDICIYKTKKTEANRRCQSRRYCTIPQQSFAIIYYENVIDETKSHRSKQRIMIRWNDNVLAYVHVYTSYGYHYCNRHHTPLSHPYSLFRTQFVLT